jgi:hypothetical protein
MQGADVVFGVDPGAGSHVTHYIELQIKTEKSWNMEQLSWSTMRVTTGSTNPVMVNWLI